MKKVIKFSVILITLIMLVPVISGCSKEANTGETTVAKGDKSVATSKTVKIGDVIQLGKFEQDNNSDNGKENIDWQVIALENGNAMLISEKILDAKPYNKENKDITWETCTLRDWLNDEFFNGAFSTSEKIEIVKFKVVNDGNLKYGTPGGIDTLDKVFLLSFEEAGKYFANDEARKAQETVYAKSNKLSAGDGSSYSGNSYWWLRSPGYYPYDAGVVYNGGISDNYSYSVSFTFIGVRPALWIKL